jgi:hypothetical protein
MESWAITPIRRATSAGVMVPAARVTADWAASGEAKNSPASNIRLMKNPG